MATTFANLKTFARDHVADMNDSKAIRQIERAVNNAFRRLARKHEWSFYLPVDRGRVNFTAEYTTGTVTVAEDGTQATLLGGVWPTAAVGRKIIFSENSLIEFNVKTRDSDLIVTFQDGQKWIGDAIVAGEYQMYQDVYSLPSDFQKLYTGRGQSEYMFYMPPREFAVYKQSRKNFTTDPTRVYTIIANDKMQVYPYPTTANLWEFMYLRWPTELTADADEMDWPEDHLDVAEDAILVEMAREFPKTVKLSLADAMALYEQSVHELWDDDKGRNRQCATWGLAGQRRGRGVGYPRPAGLITDE